MFPETIEPDPTVPATTAPDPKSDTPTVPLAMFLVDPKKPWTAPEAISPELTSPELMTVTGVTHVKSSRRNFVPSGSEPVTPMRPDVIAPDETARLPTWPLPIAPDSTAPEPRWLNPI